MALVDSYDVYDQLMNYWNGTMQDDLYMISRDGWMPELNIPEKKNAKWTDLSCDLLPVEIVVDRFFSKERDEYNNVSGRIASINEQLKAATEVTDDEDDSTTVKLSDKERLMSMAVLKKLKATLKKLDADLYMKILTKYSQIDESTVKQLIVNDKWLAAITDRAYASVNSVIQSIATQLRTLHDRYANTLSDLEAEVADKETTVLTHLKSMGFTL